MNEDEKADAIELARKLQAQADELLRAAGMTEAAEQTAVATEAAVETTAGPIQFSPEETRIIEDDEISDEREPLVQVDMREELEKVRAMLPSRGFVKKASSGAGEVWVKNGPRGEPGFTATLIADPHGRIRMEVKNPGGFVVGNAEPATEIDCAIALQQVP